MEYIPEGEKIKNWSKIITIVENNMSGNRSVQPSTLAAATGKAFYDKFFKKDKDFKLTYSSYDKVEFINMATPGFEKKVRYANQVTVYIDYKDTELRYKKYPHEREYLVMKFIKSDNSIWNVQYTVRYDKRWNKDKIKAQKEMALKTISNFSYSESDPMKFFGKVLKLNKNYDVEVQRLDDRDFNEKFKVAKSPYSK